MRKFEFLDKRRSDIDHTIVAGRDLASEELVPLDDSDREVHMYVCGVSGSGKTRFLESLILQDLAKGHPLCVIDPMGYLYRKILQAVAYGIERAEEHGFSRRDFRNRYLFLDVTDSENPVRFNPLEPQEDETAEEGIDDCLKAIERLLPESLDAQRRMRRVLRDILLVLAELNRLPEGKRPRLPDGWSYPLSLEFAGKFVYLKDEERSRLLAPIAPQEANSSALDFWRDFSSWPPRDQVDFRNSTLNVLDFITNDALVRRFFYTGQSTFRIQNLLRNGQSLFCYLPIAGSLSGAQVIGKFLATKFQRCAFRRPSAECSRPYYLYIDEFQEFADEEFAKATAGLRQFGLRLINAHQSQNQPPFNTSDGKGLLHTIRANSQIKAIFRVERNDSETLSKELFALSQQRLNFVAEKLSQTESEQENWSLAFSFQITEGTAESWSRSSSITLAKTATMGIGVTTGTNIGKSLTKGFGGSRAESLSRAISRSESNGVQEAFSEQHGVSVAIGENWSQMRDHRRGFALAEGENESFAVQRGSGRSYSETDQRGETQTDGRSEQLTLSDGTNVERGSNGSIAYYDEGASTRIMHGDNSSGGTMQSVARANGVNYSKAISRIQGIARGIEESQGISETRGRKKDIALNWGEGTSNGLGGNRQETSSDGSSSTRGKSREEGRSESETQGVTDSENWEESLSQQFSILEQVSRTYSEALQEAVSFSETVGGSWHRDVSQGETQTIGGSKGKAHTRSEEPVYYSLEGERELFINDLQRLPRQHFLLSVLALKTRRLKALNVDDQHYALRAEDLPQLLLEQQRRSLRPLVEPLPREGDHLRLVTPERKDENPEPEDWPFEG